MKLTLLVVAGLLGTMNLARSAHAQAGAADTVPAAVVQRFVDAANARQLDVMMSVVAPGAVFGPLPDDGTSLQGRDSVRAHYARVLGRLPAGSIVRVASRIADGAFVTDLELFLGAGGAPTGRATWLYYIAGGQIQRAWFLRSPPRR